MKKIKSLTNRSGLFGVVMLVLATSFSISSCVSDFDLDKRMPEWLGTSIYETLDKGFKNDSTGQEYSFKTFIRLIDDLDQKSILAKTGSKTLFVADDAAFDRFFQNCPFYLADGVTRVTSYDQLSKAQKTMILNGSMLNNVYQVAMLSSSPGGDNAPPLLGNCMRRVSAAQVMDTIPVVLPDKLPDNKYWKRLKNKSDKGVVLLQDGTNKPIIFFVNKFLQMNKIDNDDYDFLFRLGPKYSKTGKPAHTPGDASVNGVTIEWPNKKCFNGFLHVMSDVVYLLPNMAECIADPKNNSKIYSAILDRFSVPYYFPGARADRDLNVRRLINTGLVKNPALEAAMDAHNDSVYVKKYLSKRARLGTQQENESQSTNFDRLDPTNDLLKFDPGWNSFVSSTVGSNSDVALQQDMGLMFVPVDEALKQWWLDPSQVGARLRERYGDPELKNKADLTIDEVIQDMKGIPDDVIIELVNNNMQSSLVGSVPSKFSSVLNDAKDPFFESKTRAEAEETISDVVMCCNGAIYFTTNVYVPTAYKSVSYPVLVNEKLKIIDWAIKDETLAYRAYLNSMVAEYSFFVPLVDTVMGSDFEDKLVWIDPASFYLKKYNSGSTVGSLKALAFSYAKNSHDKLTVIADVYDYDETTGHLEPTGIQLIPDEVTSGNSTTDNADTKFIRNRLLDIMDYHIIIGDVEESTAQDAEGYSYFRTKGRGTIRFKSAADFHDMEASGGWQIENEGESDEIQRPVQIVQRVDLSKKTSLTPGNGRTYIIDRPLLPSRRSVYDVLSDEENYPEFSSFFKLMEHTGIFATQSNLNEIGSSACVSTFNTYHYTVYVPQNSSVDTLVTDQLDATTKRKLMLPETLGKLDTLYKFLREELKDDFGDSVGMVMFKDSLIDLSDKLLGSHDDAKITAALNAEWPARTFTSRKLDQLKNFVKYHIQDNSVYIGADFNAGIDDRTGLPADKAEYETAYMNENQQFIKVTVKGGSSITINDRNGHQRNVLQINDDISGKPYYNIMCREYEVKPITDGNTLSEGTYDDFSIETSSYAVVHLIDAPLCNGDLIF